MLYAVFFQGVKFKIMNRISFLKKLFAGSTAVIVAPQLLANEPKKTEVEFSFDELFLIHKGNRNLIYPKKESEFYKKIQPSFSDRLNLKEHHTYLPIHYLSIPIKQKYKWDDFLPVKYYFESVYGQMSKYTIESYGVSYRFIKDRDDRMHLEVFLA